MFHLFTFSCETANHSPRPGTWPKAMKYICQNVPPQVNDKKWLLLWERQLFVGVFFIHQIWPRYKDINRKTYVGHRLQPPATSQVHLLERLSLQMSDMKASWHFLQTVFFLFIWFFLRPKIHDIEFTLEPWYVHCALLDQWWTLDNHHKPSNSMVGRPKNRWNIIKPIS